VLEVPSGGETNPEKHIYDEFFLVIEGRGTTEVWRGADTQKKQVFEWQAGTLFMIPVNANYRLVNATGSPALLLAANNAPGVFNIFQSHRFIFDNDWDFRERYDMTDDFFKPRSDLEMEPVRGRAAIRSNVFADIVNAELPLDNQRAPGYRRIQPTFSGFIQDASTGGFISQYPSGRYSKAHFHASGAVLVCLRGKGYTYNWPVGAGPTPWQDGRADDVRAALLRAVPRVHAEGGCECYALHESDDRLVLVEKWASSNALATHAAAAALADLRAELAGITTGDLDIQHLTPVPAGTPAQGTL